jgi:hypothetical protein
MGRIQSKAQFSRPPGHRPGIYKFVRNKIEKIFDESRKSRPISLRINEKDLTILKEKADKNGLPYQTMINVIIHKYVNDNFLDKDEIDKYLRLKKAV